MQTQRHQLSPLGPAIMQQTDMVSELCMLPATTQNHSIVHCPHGVHACGLEWRMTKYTDLPQCILYHHSPQKKTQTALGPANEAASFGPVTRSHSSSSSSSPGPRLHRISRPEVPKVELEPGLESRYRCGLEAEQGNERDPCNSFQSPIQRLDAVRSNLNPDGFCWTLHPLASCLLCPDPRNFCLLLCPATSAPPPPARLCTDASAPCAACRCAWCYSSL